MPETNAPLWAVRILKNPLKTVLPLLILLVQSCSSERADVRVGAMDHFKRGNRYQESKQYRSAIEEYKAALALDSEQPEFHYNLGLTYYALHLFEQSIRSYKKALDLNPQFAEAWFNLSLALYRIGDTEEAFSANERYVALHREEERESK